MLKRISATLFVLILALSFSTFTFGQDAAKQEMKKDVKKTEMSKDEKAMGPLKSVACDPSCGFECKSHNEKELISIVKTHAKKMHKMEMSDAKIKEMMKTEAEAKQ
jgi:predicted small metal-binding protein